jgi:nitroreductase
VEKYLARIAEVRGVAVESLGFYRDMMSSDLLTGPRSAWVQEWAARQVYIALGNFMTAAALLGVDTCPMEGFLPAEFDNVLGLTAQGYAAVVCCALGYRSTDDKYAAAPKVRFPVAELVKTI